MVTHDIVTDDMVTDGTYGVPLDDPLFHANGSTEYSSEYCYLYRFIIDFSIVTQIK